MSVTSSAQPPTRTILLVEDEEAVRDVTRHVLESAGYLVLEASSAEHALAAFRSFGGAINLLLTDVIMPGMSGTELAARLEAVHPGFITIFMSGYSGRSSLPQPRPGAPSFYIQKPFSVSMLLSRVAEALSFPIPPPEAPLGTQLPI
jgi:two-component system, cell cycle sensor histidine kinase and response regulator CckA